MTQDNIAAAVIGLIEAGFWPPVKELQEAGVFLENQAARLKQLEEDNDRLKAALNPFAKFGAVSIKMALVFPALPIVDYNNTQITYADLTRAAVVLYGKDLADHEST
jgi:hypothetical protein